MLSLSYSGALDLQEQLYFSQFDGNCRYGQSLLKDLLRKISPNCDIAAKNWREEGISSQFLFLVTLRSCQNGKSGK